MDDLVAFLRARLDEDETVARDRLCINCGNPVVPLRSALGITGYTHEGGRTNEQGEWEQGWEGSRCPGKIVGAEPAQNPARVLREVEAKRGVIREAFRHAAKVDGEWGCCHDAHQIERGECEDNPPNGLPILPLLATTYADHPDYRREWAPDA